MPDGSFHGFEAGGIFVKTEGVNPGDQIEIYYGLLEKKIAYLMVTTSLYGTRLLH